MSKVAYHMRTKMNLRRTRILLVEKLRNFSPGRSNCRRWTSSIAEEHEIAARPFAEIPSHRVWPIVGTAWSYMPVIGHYEMVRMHEGAFKRYATFGRISKDVLVGKIKIVWLFDPNDVETLYRHESRYPMRPGFESIRLHRQIRTEDYGDGGLLLINGEGWQKFRNKFQPYLMKPKLIVNSLPPMNVVADRMVEKMHQVKDKQTGRIDNFVPMLYRWALDSLGYVTFNKNIGAIDEINPEAVTLIQSISDVFKYASQAESELFPLWQLLQRPIGSNFRKMAQAHEDFAKITVRYIKEAMVDLQNNPTPDERHNDKSILELLLSRPDGTIQEVVVMALDLVFAGVDTTSHTLAFLLYELGHRNNKAVQEKLRGEIRTVVGNETHVTASMMEQLRYLKACIKESQRIRPIVMGNARQLDKDLAIAGYTIPAGCLVVACNTVISRDEKYFPDPESFKPNRWLRGSPEKEAIHPFGSIPFSFGPRSCIGRRIAEQELILLLVKIFQHFTVTHDITHLKTLLKMIVTPEMPMNFNFVDKPL